MFLFTIFGMIYSNMGWFRRKKRIKNQEVSLQIKDNFEEQMHKFKEQSIQDWTQKRKWVAIYYEVLLQLLLKYNYTNFIPYKTYKEQEKDNKIPGNYFLKKYRPLKSDTIKFVWKFNMHHIDEIYYTSSDLKKLKIYDNGLSLKVSFEEHCFLHYLIVLANFRDIHGGVLYALKDPQKIDEIIQQQCQVFNIEYVSNWRDKIKNK
ncbi:hypothetical protein NPA08_03420 [Mycoplasmopsis citelli]|uniref:hypothetical protein n=1 Tax=Mycoplasmopsis citelli TaxID=171281 RepID=UPI0021149533|nr:hypothetical protein [Mycoplasmopsis citelli]UUD35981.1 hypothetical protein NPA08_03420 [Mycoplasmopsis citelli]